jgi:hypothetical protein
LVSNSNAVCVTHLCMHLAGKLFVCASGLYMYIYIYIHVYIYMCVYGHQTVMLCVSLTSECTWHVYCVCLQVVYVSNSDAVCRSLNYQHTLQVCCVRVQCLQVVCIRQA